jgi:hypothetical protein
MQHINGFDKLGDKKYSMFKPRVNADFLYPDANGGHRFPIVRLEPMLNTALLEPGNPARVRRKSSQVRMRRSEPH